MRLLTQNTHGSLHNSLNIPKTSQTGFMSRKNLTFPERISIREFVLLLNYFKINIVSSRFMQISRNRTSGNIQMKFALCYHGKRIADEEFKNSFYKFDVEAPNSNIQNNVIWSAVLAPLFPMVLIEKNVMEDGDLASYLNEDGCLELNIKVIIESTRMLKNVAFKSLDLIDTLSEDYEAALKDDDFKDVTFVIADK